MMAASETFRDSEMSQTIQHNKHHNNCIWSIWQSKQLAKALSFCHSPPSIPMQSMPKHISYLYLFVLLYLTSFIILRIMAGLCHPNWSCEVVVMLFFCFILKYFDLGHLNHLCRQSSSFLLKFLSFSRVTRPRSGGNMCFLFPDV